MFSIHLLIEANSKFSMIIGGILNILLIALVYKRTPKEMKFYSKIVLQTCFGDLVNLLVGDIVQPLLIIYNGVVSVVHFGISGHLPYPWNNFMFYVWLFVSISALLGVVVQFVYRYMILCRQSKLTTKTYFLMIAFVGLILIVFFGICMLITMTPADAMIEDKFLQNLLMDGQTVDKLQQNGTKGSSFPPELHQTIRSRKGDVPWVVWHVCFIALSVGGYVLIGILGFKMVVFTRKNLNSKATSEKRVIEMNKQLTLNLLIQACIPLTEMVGWVLCSYTCIFASFLSPNGGLSYISLVAFPIQSWISVLNPLVTMIIVKPYRKSVLRIIYRAIPFRTNKSNTVVPLITTKESNYVGLNDKIFKTRASVDNRSDMPSNWN